MTKRKIKVFLYLLISFLMVFTFSEHITANENVPLIYLTDIEITKGSGTAIHLNIENVKNYSALDIKVYYDQEAFYIRDVYYGYLQNEFPPHQKEFNINIPGEVHFALIMTKNTSLDGNLIYIYIEPKENTSPGIYPFRVAIAGAYNEIGDSININTEHGSVTVKEEISQPKEVYYYQNTGNFVYKQNDIHTYKVILNSSYKTVGFEYEIYYDLNVLAFEEVRLSNNVTSEIYAVNSEQAGVVKIAFARNNGFYNANPLFEIDFKVIANKNLETDILFYSKDGFDENLETLLGNNLSQRLYIEKLPNIITYPKMIISSYEGAYNKNFNLIVSIEENSLLAAGDFTINYDKSLFKIINIYDLENADYLIFNHKENQGEITFSLLKAEGYTNYLDILEIEVKLISNRVNVNSIIEISGRDTVNKDIQPIDLDYINSEIELGEFYEVKFVDYNNSVIDIINVKRGSIPIPPEVIPRTNTKFLSWDKNLSGTYSDITYKAQYELEINNLQIGNKSHIYDGEYHSLEVLNLPPSASVDYINNSYKNVGQYNVEIMFYLDNIYQGTKTEKLTIEKRGLVVTIDNVIISEIEELPNFTYTLLNKLEGDEINIEIYSPTGYKVGLHNLAANIDNDNYYISDISGTLHVEAYSWIYGDLDYDTKITIFDVAILQLYLADKYEFSDLQLFIADFNEDGRISILDVAKLQLYIAGLIDD